MTGLSRLPKPLSRVELAAKELVSLIQTQPNLQTLPSERSLASQLGLSRNALREAIRQLELQGLLKIQQGKPTRIVQNLHQPITGSLSLLVLSPKARLVQLFELREILEPKAAALAATRATASDLKELHAASSLMSEAGSNAEAVTADIAFHRAIAKASRNQILLLVLESLIEPLQEAHSKGFQVLGPRDPHPLQMHLRILNAIATRNPSDAEMAMLEHLTHSKKILRIP
jgi:GntR family transcriptional repressor for pyruvate dehydrogenase complex